MGRLLAVLVLLVAFVSAAHAVDPTDNQVIYEEPLHIPKIGRLVSPYRQHFWQWAVDSNARRTQRGTFASRPSPITQLISKAYIVTDCSTAACTVGGGSIKCVTTVNEAGNAWDVGPCDGTSSAAAFNAITGGTNTTAAMIVSTGASLVPGGSGTIRASDVVCTSCIALGSEVTGTLPLANLTDDDTTVGNCLLSGGGGGPPAWNTCPGGGGGMTSFLTQGDSGSAETITNGETFFVSGGAGVETLSFASNGVEVRTKSDDSNWVLSGALTCTTGQQGRMKVHTTPLQYCDNAGTPTLRYAAYGTSTGESTAAANTSVDLTTDVTGLLPAANGAHGFSAVTDDTIAIANGSIWQSKAIPSCSNGTTDKLLYDTATNSLSCGTDQGGGGGMTSFTLSGDGGADQAISNANTLEVAGGAGIATTGVATDTVSIATASQEVGFLADGGVANLTCGAAAGGKAQVLDGGALQWCDGNATSVLRSTDDFVKLTPGAMQTVADQITIGSGTNGGLHVDADLAGNGIGLYVEKGVGTVGVPISGPAEAFVSVIASAAGSPSILIQANNSVGTDSPILAFRHSRGTFASPTVTQTGDILGSLVWEGYGGGATPWGTGTNAGDGGIEVYAAENFTSTTRGTKMGLWIMKTGTAVNYEALSLNPDGSTSINSTAKLSPTLTAPTGTNQLAVFDPTLSLGTATITGLDFTPTITHNNAGGTTRLLNWGGTMTATADQEDASFMHLALISFTTRSTTNGIAPRIPDTIWEQWTAELSGAGVTVTDVTRPVSWAWTPTVQALAGASMTFADNVPVADGPNGWATLIAAIGPTFKACSTAACNSSGSGASTLNLSHRSVIRDYGGLIQSDNGGTANVDNLETIYRLDQTKHANTEHLSVINSQLAAGTGKYLIYSEGNASCTASTTPYPCCTGSGTGTCGTAQSVHAGKMAIGTYTDPTGNLDVGGLTGVTPSVRACTGTPNVGGTNEVRCVDLWPDGVSSDTPSDLDGTAAIRWTSAFTQNTAPSLGLPWSVMILDTHTHQITSDAANITAAGSVTTVHANATLKNTTNDNETGGKWYGFIASPIVLATGSGTLTASGIGFQTHAITGILGSTSVSTNATFDWVDFQAGGTFGSIGGTLAFHKGFYAEVISQGTYKAQFAAAEMPKANVGTVPSGEAMAFVDSTTAPNNWTFKNESGHVWRMGYASTLGSTGGTNLSATVNSYFPISGIGVPVGASSSGLNCLANLIPYGCCTGAGTGTCSELTVSTGTPGPIHAFALACGSGDPNNGASVQSYTFTLRSTLSDTALSCAISDGQTTCTDREDASPIALSGSLLEIQVVPANTPTARVAACTLYYTVDAF